jgi:hypothetical protein
MPKILQPTTLSTDPVELQMNTLSSNNNDSDKHKQETNTNRFINFDEMTNDLRKLADIFNSYATRKTFATGFFNIALVGNYSAYFFLVTLCLATISVTNVWQSVVKISDSKIIFNI